MRHSMQMVPSHDNSIVVSNWPAQRLVNIMLLKFASSRKSLVVFANALAA